MSVKRTGISASLRSKEVLYGGYSALIVVAVVILAAGANILVDQVPLRIDMTRTQVYTIGDQTRKVVAELEKDVVITHILKATSEDQQVRELLRRYGSLGKRLSVSTLDPDLNPGWARQFDSDKLDLREGSVIVSCGKKFKSIARSDMYNLTYQDEKSPPTIAGLALEQRLTSAILYVTATRNPLISALQGHGEETIAGIGIQRLFESSNYDIGALNLINLPAVPEAVDVVVILNPKNDLSAPDLDKLLSFMSAGGRILVATDPQPLPNLEELLKAYGVAIEPILVVEGDAARTTGNPLLLLPNIELHEITRGLRSNDVPVLFPFAQHVAMEELRRRSLQIETLLGSSKNSWGKPAAGDLASLERGKKDREGPFSLAVAIVDPVTAQHPRESRMVVLGSYRFLKQPFISSTPGNIEFFAKSCDWLYGRLENVVIQPKDLVRYPLAMSKVQVLIYVILVVIVIPGLVFGAGILTWLRRRHT